MIAKGTTAQVIEAAATAAGVRHAEGGHELMAADTTRRYRYVIDDDAEFEESNGEGRPLTEAEYVGNEYRACPAHPHGGTKVISFGPPQVQGCAVCGNTEYADIPYAEYLRYYGNPERHVYLGLVQETLCPCCVTWKVTDSLWNIDFMDDSPELAAVQVGTWADADTAKAWPGYAGECVRDMEGGD